MRDDSGTLLTLAVNFTVLSLLAVGGASAIAPEVHRQAVEVNQWITDRQFADLFALAQVTPGPNVLFVTLIGFKVAGIAGALVATAAMCVPTCIVAYFVGGAWERFKEARWRVAIQSGLVPITLGLICAAAFVLARAADHNVAATVITALSATVAYATRWNPLWVFALGGLIGLAGLV
jgi:chromate transporter